MRGAIPPLPQDIPALHFWGKRILKLMLKKCIVRLWPEFGWLRKVPMKGSCEHGNRPWGYMRGGKFLE
jgi:hypothetical protein